LTTANELALFSKHPTQKREIEGRRNNSRREGAAYTIRGECERLFCKTMKTVFLGEEGHMGNSSFIVMGANTHSPPDERLRAYTNYFDHAGPCQGVDAWLEIWDYRGGCSFRGFVGGKGDGKSLFAFFDASIIGRDLKQGFMALIELAESVFAVSQVVVCVDRSVGEADGKAFLKSLRWVGFDLITLDMWANDLDVTSDRWMFLGMEI